MGIRTIDSSVLVLLRGRMDEGRRWALFLAIASLLPSSIMALILCLVDLRWGLEEIYGALFVALALAVGCWALLLSFAFKGRRLEMIQTCGIGYRLLLLIDILGVPCLIFWTLSRPIDTVQVRLLLFAFCLVHLFFWRVGRAFRAARAYSALKGESSQDISPDRLIALPETLRKRFFTGQNPVQVATCLGLAGLSYGIMIAVQLAMKSPTRFVGEPRTGYPWFIGIAYFLAIIPLSLLTASASRRARQYASLSASKLLMHDRRRPVVLLRSFVDDHIRMPYSHTSFEEVLCGCLDRFGPVIAVGKPGEPLPPIGASREYLDPENWQEDVRKWIAESRFVVVIMGGTAGLGWEMQSLAQDGGLSKVIVVIPPRPPEDLAGMLQRFRWQVFRDRERGFRSLRLPANLDVATTLAVVFQSAGELTTVRSASRSSVDYEEALEVAVRLVEASKDPRQDATPCLSPASPSA